MTKDPIKDRCDMFVQLMAAHEHRLGSFVLALVPNWSDAEDIVQETKVRLWEQFDSYDPEKDFGTWACVIARYQILAYRTRSSRSRILFSQEVVNRLSDELARPNVQPDSRAAFLEQCVKKLTQWQRNLLLQSCAADYSSQKVAAQLGRKADAIRQSLLRIRRKLYRCVEDIQRREADRP